MKKIMFNDKFLMPLVLDGTKTMTRRVISDKMIAAFEKFHRVYPQRCPDLLAYMQRSKAIKYDIGEEVAIAQSYQDIGLKETHIVGGQYAKDTKGWNNKMFVKADLMPYRIKIIDYNVERLQDISDEDCLKEGVKACLGCKAIHKPIMYHASREVRHAADKNIRTTLKCDFCKDTPQKAFQCILENCCSKDIWNQNPFVEVFTFTLN